MASRLFGTSGSVTDVKYFEIRLDRSTLILRGTEDEASSVLLKGNLVLCLSEPLKVQSVRLRFTGEKRVGWGTGSAHAKKDDQFVRYTWEFLNTGVKRGGTLAAGNYEWPFEYVLPGYTPESVEGLEDSWIIYRMKATIDRGILAQNVIARKHLRIVRTLDTAALELSHEMAVENTWTGKIDYTLSTPTKGVIFGTRVQVDFRIASLLKGLKIGEISTKVNETQDIIADVKKHAKKTRVTRRIAEDRFDFPQDQEPVLIDGQDAWVFTRQITLPKSLRECLQTVDALGIRTKHSLVFNVKLINPDEHVSELHASLPLYIYISPNLLLDEDNNMLLQNLGGVNPEAFAVGAPPLYGEHQLDMLFDDLDPVGYLTPGDGLSAVGTPFAQSRRGSVDNLALVNGTANTSVLPTALQDRLDSLENTPTIRVSPTPTPDASISIANMGVIEPQGNSSHEIPLEINNANEVGEGLNDSAAQFTLENESEQPSPQHFEFSPEQLSKVPSYSTALRSHPQTPISEWPPTYQSATSQHAAFPPSSSSCLQDTTGGLDTRQRLQYMQRTQQ
ncbi:MAG: hypothetical protein Q9219_000941 [cf. Caloplaca sp. 3 TL-2023]